MKHAWRSWFEQVVVATIVLSVWLVPRPAAGAETPSPTPYGMRVEHTWIPMKDGVRLAVNLFMPTGAKSGEKFPALLEYIPYRKDDDTASDDYPRHSYFAHRGYVGARVDIRGTGESEGQTPHREYSQQEQEDGEEVIAWLARQPWSNGNVGMMGISWGGFNSLQLAMRRPPALKAIIATCATDQLFHDDIRFIDGMMHVDQYELFIDLQTAISPGPGFPLDEKTLATRFDNTPWFINYKRHQRDGSFWHEPEQPLDRIQIPVLLLGGLYDGYRDSIPQMLQQMKTPVKAILGPWNHNWPDEPDWGPAIEWRDLAVRWWDQWLKGRDTGVMDEPRFAVYMRHWYAPELNLPEVPGEWRSEESWPPAGLQLQTFYPQTDHSLNTSIPVADFHVLKYVPSTGTNAGGPDIWWGELTTDQTPDDAFSLVYDSAPLAENMAILGRPQAALEASATAPLADWFARLSDVAPDGTVTMVTGAGLNGAQRDSASEPTDLEPGRVYPLTIDMHFTSWVFPARTPHSFGRLQRSLAHDLAYAIRDDYLPPTRRTTTVSSGITRCATGKQAASTSFCSSSPSKSVARSPFERRLAAGRVVDETSAMNSTRQRRGNGTAAKRSRNSLGGTRCTRTNLDSKCRMRTPILPRPTEKGKRMWISRAGLSAGRTRSMFAAIRPTFITNFGANC